MNSNKSIKTNTVTPAANGETRTTNHKTSAIQNLKKNKVLGVSNRTLTDTNKMGLSQVTTLRRSTSKRMSGTMTQRLKNPTATLDKRKTMDSKSSHRMTISSGEKKCAANVSKTLPKSSSGKLSCQLCGMTFFFKTSLDAHSKTHENTNSCKYCGRKFSIQAAIFKHLRERCTKIPTAERKKLFESDAKAENLQTPIKTPKLNRATNEIIDLVFASCSSSSGFDRADMVTFKDFSSIKGIRHTPRKLIKCFECGDKFKNPLLYATHAEQCVPAKINFK